MKLNSLELSKNSTSCKKSNMQVPNALFSLTNFYFLFHKYGLMITDYKLAVTKRTRLAASSTSKK